MLAGDAAPGREHFELEAYIKTEDFELLRLLLQEHFGLLALSEVCLGNVSDASRQVCTEKSSTNTSVTSPRSLVA